MTSVPALPLMRDVMQIAYVTSDLDRAMEVMQGDFGCGDFLVMRDVPGSLTQMALAFSGDTMFELLEPIAESGDFYSNHLAGAEGFTIRHHHFGMLVDSREGMAERRARHLGLGHTIAMEGETEGVVQYLYVDCRKPLGHFLEYIRLDEGGRQMFAAVPGSPYA